MTNVEGWPWKYQFLSRNTNGEPLGGNIIVNFPLARENALGTLYVATTEYERTLIGPLGSGQTYSCPFFDRCEVSGTLDYTVSALGEDRYEVVIEADYPDFYGMQPPPEPSSPWSPTLACSEAYKYTLELEHLCPNNCKGSTGGEVLFEGFSVNVPDFTRDPCRICNEFFPPD